MSRQRSMALVVRKGRILMVRLRWGTRSFLTLPGGGIEEGETPEDAAVRELWEECRIRGEVVRKLAVVHRLEAGPEHVFLVQVDEDAEASLGLDPEYGEGAQDLMEVRWVRLKELPERDRAFLWSYGLLEVPDFRQEALAWTDTISYPMDDGGV